MNAIMANLVVAAVVGRFPRPTEADNVEPTTVAQRVVCLSREMDHLREQLKRHEARHAHIRRMLATGEHESYGDHPLYTQALVRSLRESSQIERRLGAVRRQYDRASAQLEQMRLDLAAERRRFSRLQCAIAQLQRRVAEGRCVTGATRHAYYQATIRRMRARQANARRRIAVLMRSTGAAGTPLPMRPAS